MEKAGGLGIPCMILLFCDLFVINIIWYQYVVFWCIFCLLTVFSGEGHLTISATLPIYAADFMPHAIEASLTTCRQNHMLPWTPMKPNVSWSKAMAFQDGLWCALQKRRLSVMQWPLWTMPIERKESLSKWKTLKILVRCALFRERDESKARGI